MSRFFKSAAFPILIVIVLAFFASKLISRSDEAPATSFSRFLTQLEHGDVKAVTMRTKDNSIEVRLNKAEKNKYTVGYPVDYAEVLVNKLRQEQATGQPDRLRRQAGAHNVLLSMIGWILPVIIFIGFWLFLMNQVQGGGSKVMSFGKSRAKRMSVDSPKITFRDVAGVDEAVEELHEIKEFLENPKKFQALGARIPKGVLLYGPPGTGKTLLARAVAGEAGVPFFSISGSDFVEMFVGVGASRVRDLFEQAKQNSPCIIFMDEIDAVGRHRGAGMGGGHDEREQTLNQLLVEMDGFEAKDNIIMIAATNRPDILDPALLRPGRFDRQITVDRPDRKGRARILEVHTRGKPLAKDIETDALAGQTPGFTGADLSNLVNEAALLAARTGKKEITQTELEEGIMRVVAGPEKKTRVMGEKERLITAYHEMGHAIVGHFLEHSDPVHKISIISRGQALGYTISMPQEDKFLTTRAELNDTMAMTLGGRAAEEIVFNEITTGASNDLEKVTATAKQMVMRFGMSREARPARLRPRPRPAVPRPRVLLRARLLRRDRARDRRRDPAHRRGRAPDRQGRAARAPRVADDGSPSCCSSARRSRARSSRRCSRASPPRRSSAPTRRRRTSARPSARSCPARPTARRASSASRVPASPAAPPRRAGSSCPRSLSWRSAAGRRGRHVSASWASSTSRRTRSPTAAPSSIATPPSTTACGSRSRAPTCSTSAASRRGPGADPVPEREELERVIARDRGHPRAERRRARLDRHLEGRGRRRRARCRRRLRQRRDRAARRPGDGGARGRARRRRLPDAHARHARARCRPRPATTTSSPTSRRS